VLYQLCGVQKPEVDTKRTIAQTIHPYPIQAEAIRKIGDAYKL